MVRSNQNGLQLSSEEFLEFRDYLQDIAGIDLGNNKQYLVSTRLRRVLAEEGSKCLAELTAKIKSPSNMRLRQRVIDVMTTNETYWFRDSYPFDYLKLKVLPEFYKKNPHSRFRIWSAACSSGQEPFSLSIAAEECMRENYLVKNLMVEIVATDLSSEVLDQAKKGLYDRLSITRGLSPERLRNYFEQISENQWKAQDEITQRIVFRSLNLKDSYVALGKFDMIFCRNVLIYFSPELKQNILARMHAALRPGGLLFLGSSESLNIASEHFEMLHCNPGVMYRAK